MWRPRLPVSLFDNRLRGIAGGKAIGTERLELDQIRTRLRGGIDHPFGQLQIAIMVHSGLGNDKNAVYHPASLSCDLWSAVSPHADPFHDAACADRDAFLQDTAALTKPPSPPGHRR